MLISVENINNLVIYFQNTVPQGNVTPFNTAPQGNVTSFEVKRVTVQLTNSDITQTGMLTAVVQFQTHFPPTL